MLIKFICDEESPISLSQKSIKVAVKFCSMLETRNQEVLKGLGQNLEEMLLLFQQKNKVIYVRLFELAVLIACKSEYLAQNLAKGTIRQVFKDFE